MSMTPEQARGFVCPVRGTTGGPEQMSISRTEEGKSREVSLERNRTCIGPACMWWVTDPIYGPEGDCAINEMIAWANAINDNVRE